ncbi:hypothetical protein MMC07_009033, partial [Pseudocyphellaria aurata]|nr:hypothetical protein [Pseudocyphellaria aurata]
PDNEPLTGRFGSALLSNALIQVFWPKSALTLATHPYTKQILRRVPDLVIVFVCVALEHAIREYETGRKVSGKFEGNGVSLVEGRIRRTFDAQTAERKKNIKWILGKQIRMAVNVDKEKGPCDADIIHDPCKDTIDDLPLDELT